MTTSVGVGAASVGGGLRALRKARQGDARQGDTGEQDGHQNAQGKLR